tara:strand:+ start:772 stop:1629 length:858 start_codon:yes stop_codon:yes gene_type:complete
MSEKNNKRKFGHDNNDVNLDRDVIKSHRRYTNGRHNGNKPQSNPTLYNDNDTYMSKSHTDRERIIARFDAEHALKLNDIQQLLDERILQLQAFDNQNDNVLASIRNQVKKRQCNEVKNPVTCMLLVSHFCKNAYTTLHESVHTLQADSSDNYIATKTSYKLIPSTELPVIDSSDPFLVCTTTNGCSNISHCVAHMGIGITLPSMKSINTTIDVSTCIICEYARITAISMLCQNSALSVMKFTKFIDRPLCGDGSVRCLPKNLDGFSCTTVDGKIHHLTRNISKND